MNYIETDPRLSGRSWNFDIPSIPLIVFVYLWDVLVLSWFFQHFWVIECMICAHSSHLFFDVRYFSARAVCREPFVQVELKPTAAAGSVMILLFLFLGRAGNVCNFMNGARMQHI
jgi:hypothetical protein